MKITIMGTNSKTKDIGDTNQFPVPKIDERIEVGYNPPPKVKEVVYNYDLNCVVIIIDGVLL